MSRGLTVPDRAARVVAEDLAIQTLGPCRYASPLTGRLARRAIVYVGEADRILLDDRISAASGGAAGDGAPPAFELAGPRDRIFFDPTLLRCAVVTCGGLCPGLNNVLRALVLELSRGYGVTSIIGFRYGYEGLAERSLEPMRLTPASVSEIHHEGGTVLGSSRGSQDPARMVDRLTELGVGVLFVVGGDGSLRGAISLVEEIERRGLDVAVVGIPKTIDNDIHFIDQSFGFDSAFAAAVDVLRGAHVEATGARNGIGLVKLMGRHSGFIACHAALASADVDAVLIPEVPIEIEGSGGLFAFLDRRLSERAHALVVVAEGAGQDLCAAGDEPVATDPSGNRKLKDVGVELRRRILAHYRARGLDVVLKYVDPSYHIRSVPASPTDRLYCASLARHAAHAAMAGNTAMLIGRWHGRFVHVPMSLVTRYRKRVDVDGDLYMGVVESTGQPLSWQS